VVDVVEEGAEVEAESDEECDLISGENTLISGDDLMPEISRKINGKKYMWDGTINEKEEDARNFLESYKSDNFETELVTEDGKFLVYTRRIVSDVVIEGDASI
jgi:hypothetical protein